MRKRRERKKTVASNLFSITFDVCDAGAEPSKSISLYRTHKLAFGLLNSDLLTCQRENSVFAHYGIYGYMTLTMKHYLQAFCMNLHALMHQRDRFIVLLLFGESQNTALCCKRSTCLEYRLDVLFDLKQQTRF